MNTPPPARPVRVLLVHNAYQQRGGEDAVAEAEAALLRQHGHEVELYMRHNDEVNRISRFAVACDTLWSLRTRRDLQALFMRHRPDIVHVHNSFPLISPSVYWAAARAGLPVVQTLHNFRLLCPQAQLLRESRICEDCVGRVPWRAVQHGCYRGSIAQSAAVAGMLQLHRSLGTWQHQVTLYIALNAFCRDKFIEGGLPAARIRIKPNFVDLSAPAPAPQPREGFLFVGRYSQEKGLAVLAQALGAAPPGLVLRAAGSGPDEHVLSGAPGVDLLGPLAPTEVYAQMARHRALVLPSIWYENFPRTLVEAFANGLPVIASRLGAMATLVDDGVTGLLFRPGDARDLATKLAWAQTHPAEMQHMGENARRYYESALTGQANLHQLRALYAEAIALLGDDVRRAARK